MARDLSSTNERFSVSETGLSVIPVTTVAVLPIPEEPTVRSAVICSTLSLGKHCSDFLGWQAAALAGASAQSHAPLSDAAGKQLKLFAVLFNVTKVTPHGKVVVPVKAVVIMHVKAEIAMSATAACRKGCGHLSEVSLEGGKQHCNMILRHTCPTDRGHCQVVVFAKFLQWNLSGRLVADLDSCDASAISVSKRKLLQGLQGLHNSPLRPMPLGLRPKPSSAGCVGTFTTRTTVKIEHNLETDLVRPIERPIDVFHRRPLIWLAVAAAHDDPIAKRQPDGVEAHLLDLYEVLLGDVGLPMLS
mmetsp:Transcript_72890/g.131300  ORF Transcript_72890/g.131300 Transcript_72890/m.131300 type:complete len:302 (+) Transcript_72890:421-1326(+)